MHFISGSYACMQSNVFSLVQLRTAKKRASQSTASEEPPKTQGALKKEHSVDKDEDDGRQFST